MTPLFSTALLRTQSDERLVRLARQGHEPAFEVIVNRYRRALQRYCERVLPRPRAEDVVQQVLMKAWVAFENGAEVRSLRPWLYGIARTAVLDSIQTPGYDYGELSQSLLGADEPESELEQRAVIRKTLTGLAALPEPQREALLRAAFEGQSRAQIADALGISEGAVRQLLYRARTTLRAAATAVTPLPFATWLAAAGPGSTGAVVESGTTGTVGVAGIVKASALLAAAGAVATGSVAHHHSSAASRAKAKPARRSAPQPDRSPVIHQVVVSSARPVSEVRASPVAHGSASHESSSRDEGSASRHDSSPARSDEHQGNEGNHGVQEPDHQSHGDSVRQSPAEPAQPEQSGSGGDGNSSSQPNNGGGGD